MTTALSTMPGAMTRRRQPPSDFGRRLIAIRKARGLTQVQLAEAIGSSQRAISYYESETGHAPAPVIVQLARALDVSADELLGLQTVRVAKKKESPEKRRLWKKFQKLQSLPIKDQRAVIRLLNSLATRKAG
jgi:transcriptional regulator with XRE-family HTH domain